MWPIKLREIAVADPLNGGAERFHVSCGHGYHLHSNTELCYLQGEICCRRLDIAQHPLESKGVVETKYVSVRNQGDFIEVSVYDKRSVGPSIRPVCTRCCLTMTDMIQVCSNLIKPECLS